MKRTYKKITRFFKTDIDIFIEELQDYRDKLDGAIKVLERDIQTVGTAINKHKAIGQYLKEKQKSKYMRIDSLDQIIIQYVKTDRDEAAKNFIREKVKEQQNLGTISEIIEMHNQKIREYQQRLKKLQSTLDNQNSHREAFIIQQQIALQELTMIKKLDKKSWKNHIEKIQKEIIQNDSNKITEIKIDVLNNDQLEIEIEKELSLYQKHYASSGLQRLS